MQAVVVAENPSAANRIRGILTEHGHHCSQVIRPVEARRALSNSSQAPDVVFIAALNELDACLEAMQQPRLSCTQTKFIAVSQGSDPQRILNAIRSGAHDYWDENQDLLPQLQLLVQRLDQERLARDHKGKIIAIGTAAGGSGCSVLATNLSAGFAAEHGTCGLVDLNLRGGDLATMLNLSARHSIADLNEHTHLDDAMIQQSLIAHTSGIRLLASPGILEITTPLSMPRLDQIFDQLRGTYPYTIVDLEDLFHAEQLHVLSQCDRVAIITRLEFVSLLRTFKNIRILEREGIPLEKVDIVVNRYNAPGSLPRRKARAALKMGISAFIPDDPKTINHAINSGHVAILQAPTSRFTKAIKRLVKRIALAV